VSTYQIDEMWHLARLLPEITVQGRGGKPYRPMLFAVTKGADAQLLTLHISHPEDSEEAFGQALYHAIVSQRTPAPLPQGTAGLRWALPRYLSVDGELPEHCRCACSSLGITTVNQGIGARWLSELISKWTRDFAGRTLTTQTFLRAFDTYIYRTRGESSLRRNEEQERAFAHLIGYNRDPAWLFPTLRLLLPVRPGTISDEGTVACSGLTYDHRVLTLWPGETVSVRQSLSAESDAWVYLGDEIVCLAKARELRRKDGTYRPWR
jgi:hypothetical protein